MNFSSQYLQEAFKPEVFQAYVSNTVEIVTDLKSRLKFDAIAFTGVSGAAMAFPVSYITGIPLICVRKQEQSHGKMIEGHGNFKKYLILDDFICTGTTICRILEQLEEIKCVGIVVWNREVFQNKFERELLDANGYVKRTVNIPLYSSDVRIKNSLY